MRGTSLRTLPVPSRHPQPLPPQHLNAPLFAAIETDIVGYATIKTQAGWNMLAINFENLSSDGGEDSPISINTVLSGNFQEGDYVQCFDKSTGVFTTYKWTPSKNEWCVGRNSADDFPVRPGTAFWLLTEGRSVPVTVRGAVYKDSINIESDLQGYQMMAADVPYELELNGANVVWTNLSERDEIQVNDPVTGTPYTYQYSTSRGKWMLGRQVADVKIGVGRSFWLKTARTPVSVSVNK